MANTPIPTIDVLPPMSAAVRDFMYGILAWAAAIVTIITLVFGINPDAGIPQWLEIVNTVVVALWTFGGFKAKANVPPS